MQRKSSVNYSDNKLKSNIELAKDKYIRVPLTDIIEKKDNIIVICGMPGVDKSKVEIEFEDNVLSIVGWQKERKYEEYELIHSDYRTGVYKRSFNVLTEIDTEKIKANVKDGILTITLPKHERVKPKKISVQAD